MKQCGKTTQINDVAVLRPLPWYFRPPVSWFNPQSTMAGRLRDEYPEEVFVKLASHSFLTNLAIAFPAVHAGGLLAR